jgi:hypothetical protein
VTGRISKSGDASVRAMLYEAAHVILIKPIKGGSLNELGGEDRTYNMSRFTFLMRSRQNVERHFRSYIPQPFHQEVRRPHPEWVPSLSVMRRDRR